MYKSAASSAMIAMFLALSHLPGTAAEQIAPVAPNVAAPKMAVRPPITPMTAAERTMWDEYLVATQRGAVPAALQNWARKYNVAVSTGTTMTLRSKVITGVPGSVSGGVVTPAQKCSDVCAATSSIWQVLDKARTIVTTCRKLESCYYDKDAKGWRCNYGDCTTNIQTLQ